MSSTNYISRFKKSRASVWLSLLVVACILNISIDPPDLHPHIPENLAVNEIESIVEFALEVVCKIENSVPEAEDPDNEKFQNHLGSFVSSDKIEVISCTPFCLIAGLIFPYSTQDPTKGIISKVSPPPKFG